jgi:superfamily II DNA or RNA helicase
MLKDVDYPISGEYRTGTNNEPINFFIDAIPESSSFDLLLGYFSSTAIQVLSVGFAKFIASGGRMRMIINHILSARDKEALKKGSHTSEKDYSFSSDDYHRLRTILDEYGTHFFECLAWLIASKRIQIVAVKPKEGSGISHFKSGILSDGENKVRFKGSCNFTGTALLDNLEELDIRRSWVEGNEEAAFIEYEGYFNHIFSKESDRVEYIPVEDIETAIINSFGNKSIEELLADEEMLFQKRLQKLNSNPSFLKKVNQLSAQFDTNGNSPRFPYAQGPREYQIEAFENWQANGKKGIFAMATGTGKTITSLNCLLQEYYASGLYRGLILVPTNTLVEQWEKEAHKFNFKKNIIKVSSRFQWQNELDMLLTSLEFGGEESFVIITTYASFHRPKFQHILKQLPKDTLLIADEAHNIASPKLLEVFPNVQLQKRLALSATPRRAYDPEGTDAMERFFDDKEPYAYSFSMERAIKEEVLCKYYYYPQKVYLSGEELKEYVDISTKLAKFFNSENDSFPSNDIVTQLLMKRKRVIHKAENKLETFKKILKKEHQKRGNLKYTFVYVPEGYKTAEGEDDSEEEIRIINEYSQAIMQTDPSITVSQFLGETENKDAILELSAQGKIDVLASMKCLDEGVDVPRTELAIFCASTGNPRQFIQRRGRVLRQHPDKHMATVYDMIVLPDPSASTVDDKSFNLERNLVKKELERVAHFAFMAINRYEAIEVFEEICTHYYLDIYTIHEALSEK